MGIDFKFTVSLKTTKAVIANREPALLARFAMAEPELMTPIRIPGAHKNQTHIPGHYYMARIKKLVWYESRLEMVVLKQLDFDPTLFGVLPQPFTIHYTKDGKPYRHTPDFLVWRKDAKPLVIDVKPRRSVNTERNARAFAVTRRLTSEIDFDFSIQSEPEKIYLANLSWISAYRRLPNKFSEFAETLVERAESTISFRELIADLSPRSLVVPVAFHLMWQQQLKFDMHQILNEETPIGWEIAAK